MKPTSAHRARANLVLICVIVLFAALSGRLYYLQNNVHADYARRAAGNARLRVRVPAERGALLGNDGTKLAVSLPAGQVCADLRFLGDRRETARKLAPLLKVQYRDLYNRLTSDRVWVVLAREMPLEDAMKVRELRLKGVHVLHDTKRSYPHGSLFCHVVGVCGTEKKGLEGLELVLDKKLAGTDGIKVLGRDARQRRIVIEDGYEVAPKPGQSVVLSVDPAIQYILAEEIAAAVDKFRPKAAWGVALDPATGGVRGIVSWPHYDPNDLSSVTRAQMRNRVITDSFEPGSTFKPFTWAKSLEYGLARLGESINCEQGVWQIGPRIIHSSHPYGYLSFEKGLVKSDNIMAAKLGRRLGIERLYESVKLLGFGEKTGIEFPGESSGLVLPRASWNEVYSTTSVAFGHEIAVTPLQLVAGHAAIANGGLLMRPTIIDRYVDAAGRTITRNSNPPKRRVVPEDIALRIRDIMGRVVEEGTGRRARIAEYALAGKTGTAQKREADGTYSHSRFIGSFVGFGPAENPRLVVLISMDEPKGSYYGGTVAAPYVGNVLRRSLMHLGVPRRPYDIARNSR